METFIAQCKNILNSKELWVSVAVALLFTVFFIVLDKLEKHSTRDLNNNAKETAQIRSLYRFLKYMLVFFAVIVILDINNVNVTSLVTGLGVAGAIVGFALQNFLQDLIMGMYVRGDNFFNIGDVISYQDGYWEVTDITVRATKLRNIDTGDVFTIRNHKFSEARVVSDYQDITIPGSYEVPATKMRTVCEAVCDAIYKQVHGVTKVEFIGTEEFGSSEIVYKIRVHGNQTLRVTIMRQSNGIIQDVLAQNGLDIPFNQLDLHIKDQTNLLEKQF